MDLSSPKEIKNILLQYDARPSKRLGQNFLINKNVLQKIILTANLNKNDVVLEVGPGIGTLTQELAKNAGKVIAIEKDKKMIEILKKTLSGFNNIEIINTDILRIKTKSYKLKAISYKVVANIPYYLTSPLIRKLLEYDPPVGGPPQEIILMVQKEVAKRICAKPPDMNLLAVSVQFYAEPKIVSYVSKNCFWPSPKVDSAIIKIIPNKVRPSVIRKKDFNKLFFKIVKAGFSQPRKQLGNNLSKNLKTDRKKIDEWLLNNNIKPAQRAETLSIKNWIELASSFLI
ncbi:MAG: ribosomal RNA small subunit methyltransferase A [Candidatus Staskawiczbacteria bacterium RIFCSPLOWO2_01_FULL_37_25b]|uniref:Ribosomal RNA small subunit methyltransferase A n=2 Tax=Candidatus Staskawicziibacteriota TaxID=1817916 RepID=A0A1G2HMD7_9BACT|nr:MAG: ribosomal RNA small subunit methyltransferase A [Candidatus Staskawiczbacteria bacterium RIFCSPHIGHO2_01_FULL_36_16]OGZ72574.1 MAG: ribosomal RNA small subunit methyltransferase A [Candidatus Staskawiczbacteria bacterium RIFCSPLOWO2_01_FULL_37_25b]